MNIEKILAICGAALIFCACGNTADLGTNSERNDNTIITEVPVSVQTAAADESSFIISETETSPVAENVPPTETSAAAEPEVILPSAEADSSEQEAVQNAVQNDSSESASENDHISEPYSKAYALYDVGSGTVIAGHSLDEKISLASTTKLLTASVMLKYLPAYYEITVGDEVYLAKEDSTLSGITPGTQLTVRELLAAMLLPSGNDAAYTVAVNTARAAANDFNMTNEAAVEYFCGLMNDFAAELGMNDSRFANPEGWDDPGHYTTLNDLLKLSSYAMTQPEIREVAACHEYYCEPPTGGSYYWVNTNLFLDPSSEYYRRDCIGLKTGTTADAGCCLIAAFDINGKEYICAVMGCNENWERYYLAQTILNTYL